MSLSARAIHLPPPPPAPSRHSPTDPVYYGHISRSGSTSPPTSRSSEERIVAAGLLLNLATKSAFRDRPSWTPILPPIRTHTDGPVRGYSSHSRTSSACSAGSGGFVSSGSYSLSVSPESSLPHLPSPRYTAQNADRSPLLIPDALPTYLNRAAGFYPTADRPVSYGSSCVLSPTAIEVESEEDGESINAGQDEDDPSTSDYNGSGSEPAIPTSERTSEEYRDGRRGQTSQRNLNAVLLSASGKPKQGKKKRTPGYVRPIILSRKRLGDRLLEMLRAAPVPSCGTPQNLQRIRTFPFSDLETRLHDWYGLRVVWPNDAAFKLSELRSTRRMRIDELNRLEETLDSGRVRFELAEWAIEDSRQMQSCGFMSPAGTVSSDRDLSAGVEADYDCRLSEEPRWFH